VRVTDSPARTVVVVPTFNERDNIRRLIPAILEQGAGFSVLVVDDNSPDGTAAVVDELARTTERVALVRRPLREGIGPAYKAGFAQALRAGADHIVQMDADFSHPVAALNELVSHLGEYDLVLGSRYLNGVAVVNWPIGRLLLSYFGNCYTRLVTGLPARDATGGFKCWRRQALERVQLERVRSNGYAFQIETTYRAWRRGCRIKEIPIIFVERTMGESKMGVHIAAQALWIVWWLPAMHLLGRL
jgi:dolichol-phosphate mannosyltransferase